MLSALHFVNFEDFKKCQETYVCAHMHMYAYKSTHCFKFDYKSKVLLLWLLKSKTSAVFQSHRKTTSD